MDSFNLHAFNNLHRLQQEQNDGQRRKKNVNDVLDSLSVARSGHGERRTAQSKFEEDYLKPPPRHYQDAAYSKAEEGFEHLLNPTELREWREYQGNIQKAVYDAKFGKGPAAHNSQLVHGSAALDGVGAPEAGSLQALLAGLKRSKTFEQRVTSLATSTSEQLQADKSQPVSGATASASTTSANTKVAAARFGRRSKTNDGLVLHTPSQHTNVLHVADRERPSPAQVPVLVLPSTNIRASVSRQLSQLQLQDGSCSNLPSPRRSASGVPFSPRSPRQASGSEAAFGQQTQAVDSPQPLITRDVSQPNDPTRVKFQLDETSEDSEASPCKNPPVKEDHDGTKPRPGPIKQQSTGSISYGRRSGLIESIDSDRDSPARISRRSAGMINIEVDRDSQAHISRKCTGTFNTEVDRDSPACISRRSAGTVNVLPAVAPSSLVADSFGNLMAAQIQAQQKFLELVGAGSNGSNRGSFGHLGRMSLSGNPRMSLSGNVMGNAAGTASGLAPSNLSQVNSTSAQAPSRKIGSSRSIGASRHAP